MKERMKLGFALSAVVTMVLLSGLASAQKTDHGPVCLELGLEGDTVTMLWRLGNGDIAEDYEVYDLYIAEYPGEKGLAPITPTGPGTATWPWDDSLESSNFAQLTLQNEAGEAEEQRIYLAVPYEVAAERIDMGFDTPAEAILAGGSCPNLSLSVDGATFAEEGGDISMSANDDMTAPYQWKKDGADIGGETNATFALSGTLEADTGIYTLQSSVDFGKATVTSNPVAVAVFPAGSLPVTGLLGLGLLAVTSALAGGTVLVRMKK